MIFVDTSAFLARYIAGDQHHAAATQYWEVLADSDEACITSNFVIDELLTLLVRRTSIAFAADRARLIYSSTALLILRPDESIEVAAVILLSQFAKPDVSFTDCVSFALMRRHGVSDAFTFDSDFTIAGFRIKP